MGVPGPSPGGLLCAGPGEEEGPGKEEKQPLVNLGVRQRCFGSQVKKVFM